MPWVNDESKTLRYDQVERSDLDKLAKTTQLLQTVATWRRDARQSAADETQEETKVPSWYDSYKKCVKRSNLGEWGVLSKILAQVTTSVKYKARNTALDVNDCNDEDLQFLQIPSNQRKAILDLTGSTKVTHWKQLDDLKGVGPAAMAKFRQCFNKGAGSEYWC